MSSAAQLAQTTLAAPFTGGVCDLSKRTYFADTVAGAITFTFVNRPADCMVFEVEVNLISGTMTWPANVRWVWGGALPQNLQAGKIHLFQFRRPQSTGTDQWLGAYQGNY